MGLHKQAGIGKVRHFSIKGLWVQEVRISGRIANRKVLGEKKPRRLARKAHVGGAREPALEDVEHEVSCWRAELAPTLDSVESYFGGWYSTYQIVHDYDKDHGHDDLKLHEDILTEHGCDTVLHEGVSGR